MGYALVWFKRDLRWHDHAALAQASQSGPIRCIYIIEPELWLQADCALQHFEFIRESLQSLDAHLRSLGGQIEIHQGELPEVLSRIWAEAPFTGLYAHEETGNGFTFARDLKVAAWCKQHAVGWHEHPQFGVVRRLKSRNQWQSAWEQHMAQPIQALGPLRFWRPPSPKPFAMSAPSHLTHNPPLRQQGGREKPWTHCTIFCMPEALATEAAFPLRCRHPMPAPGCLLIWPMAASACAKWCNKPGRTWTNCHPKRRGTALV